MTEPIQGNNEFKAAANALRTIGSKLWCGAYLKNGEIFSPPVIAIEDS